jgi:hypothetical protein
MFTPSFNSIKKVIGEKGYKFFIKPHSINIIGIRVDESLNTFNDTLCVLYYDTDSVQHIFHFPCTTKAGKHWLLNPWTSRGTAILLEGQYRNAYKIGVHNRSRPSRSYTAFEQASNMLYVRDNDRDLVHDYSGISFSALLKTNIHRSSVSGWSKFVDKWSAGCQVVTGKYDSNTTNWEKLLSLGKKSSTIYGNSFTYTLLNKCDF